MVIVILVYGSLKFVFRFSFYGNKLPIEEKQETYVNVKEYQINLRDLVQSFGFDKSLLLTTSQNDSNLQTQNFEIKFHDFDSQAPSISVFSSVITSENFNINRGVHFSAVRVHFSNSNVNNTSPDRITVTTGFRSILSSDDEK